MLRSKQNYCLLVIVHRHDEANERKGGEQDQLVAPKVSACAQKCVEIVGGLWSATTMVVTQSLRHL